MQLIFYSLTNYCAVLSEQNNSLIKNICIIVLFPFWWKGWHNKLVCSVSRSHAILSSKTHFIAPKLHVDCVVRIDLKYTEINHRIKHYNFNKCSRK